MFNKVFRAFSSECENSFLHFKRITTSIQGLVHIGEQRNHSRRSIRQWKPSAWPVPGFLDRLH